MNMCFVLLFKSVSRYKEKKQKTIYWLHLEVDYFSITAHHEAFYSLISVPHILLKLVRLSVLKMLTV